MALFVGLFVSTIIIGFSWLLFKKWKYFFLFELDRQSDHNGGELIADVLKAHGVQFVFTLCGGHISPILVAAERQNIQVIDVRHEASAVFAADAVARLSGTVGVAVVTAGPGVTNTVTAVKNAQMAESPIIILGGAAAGLLRGRGSLQDIDQLSLFSSVCKWSGRVNRVRDIIPVLCRAFYEASSGTPGPVFVEFPIDTLYPYNLVKQHMRIPENPTSFSQRIIKWYLQFYLIRLFASGFIIKPCAPGEEPTEIPVRKPFIPLPRSSDVSKLVELIAKAERPVLIVSSQALLPPVSASETAEHVKQIGIPVYLTGMARGLLGRRHPLGFRHARRTALREADLIILAGAMCDFRLDYGRVFNRKAKIVSINRDKKKLRQNSDIFWSPRQTINADVGSTLKDIAVHIGERFPCPGVFRCPESWINELKAREDHRDEEIRSNALAVSNDRLNPLSVLWNLEHSGLSTEDDADHIIVADGGDFVGSAAYILRPRGPLSWLDPGPFGTLGVGGGFALGAKLCRPNATVWVVYGDGSAGYSIAEWDSMARHRAPAIAVIGNDACWSQIARDQVTMFNSRVACMLNSISYDVIGASYAGADFVDGTTSMTANGAFLLDKQNESMTAQYLNAAKDMSAKGKPSVINCHISRSDFRDGSISL